MDEVADITRVATPSAVGLAEPPPDRALEDQPTGSGVDNGLRPQVQPSSVALRHAKFQRPQQDAAGDTVEPAGSGEKSRILGGFGRSTPRDAATNESPLLSAQVHASKDLAGRAAVEKARRTAGLHSAPIAVSSSPSASTSRTSSAPSPQSSGTGSSTAPSRSSGSSSPSSSGSSSSGSSSGFKLRSVVARSYVDKKARESWMRKVNRSFASWGSYLARRTVRRRILRSVQDAAASLNRRIRAVFVGRQSIAQRTTQARQGTLRLGATLRSSPRTATTSSNRASPVHPRSQAHRSRTAPARAVSGAIARAIRSSRAHVGTPGATTRAPRSRQLSAGSSAPTTTTTSRTPSATQATSNAATRSPAARTTGRLTAVGARLLAKGGNPSGSNSPRSAPPKLASRTTKTVAQQGTTGANASNKKAAGQRATRARSTAQATPSDAKTARQLSSGAPQASAAGATKSYPGSFVASDNSEPRGQGTHNRTTPSSNGRAQHRAAVRRPHTVAHHQAPQPNAVVGHNPVAADVQAGRAEPHRRTHIASYAPNAVRSMDDRGVLQMAGFAGQTPRAERESKDKTQPLCSSCQARMKRIQAGFTCANPDCDSFQQLIIEKRSPANTSPSMNDSSVPVGEFPPELESLLQQVRAEEVQLAAQSA